MLTKRSTLLLITAVVVLAAVFTGYLILRRGTSGTDTDEAAENGLTPPVATGEVDDAVNAILRELDDVEAVLAEEEGDAAIMTGDEAAVNDFSQATDVSF